MIPARTKRQLEQLDWDFSEHLPGTSKTIHWYPGTFPADIPTTIIQALSKPNDLVLDPYGGVGTTALEAIRQARKAWLVESNPIGCLASYVSCGALLLKAIDGNLVPILINSLRSIIDSCATGQGTQSLIDTDSMIAQDMDRLLSRLVRPTPEAFDEVFSSAPAIGHLADWIEKETLRDIKTLLARLQESPIGPFGRLVGKAMLSAILRSASSQTQSWGHIADNVWPKSFERKDVFRSASLWLTRFETMVAKTQVVGIPKDHRDELRLWVSLHNWALPELPTTRPKFGSALMVTSPPYAGAIDYTLAQRLSLYLFGFVESDVNDLSKGEFGARRRRRQPHSLESWAEELADALSKQLLCMLPEAFSAFVLPHKDAGRDVGTLIMEDCLASLEWKKVIEVDRSIRQVRARQSWTSIKRETIHIFAR